MNRIEIPTKVSAMCLDLKRFDEKGVSDKDFETYRQYCEFLKQNRSNLDFIREFRKSLWPYRDYCFKIDKEEATSIIESHSKAFSTYPSVDFIKQEFFHF